MPRGIMWETPWAQRVQGFWVRSLSLPTKGHSVHPGDQLLCCVSLELVLKPQV